jgi:phosphopantetheine adenylyltransferase
MNILYPGSFNPWHDGHKYILDTINMLFPNSAVHTTRFINPSKPSVTYTGHLHEYSGTIDTYCTTYNIDLIVRGMRTYLDPKEDSEWLDYVLKATYCPILYIKSPKHLESLSSSRIRSN